MTPREFCPPRDERTGPGALAGPFGSATPRGWIPWGVATYLATNREVVGRDEGGLGIPTTLGPAEEQRGSSFLPRVSWDRRIDREGYAYPVRRPTAGGLP